MNPEELREQVRQKGSELYRDMPWREDTRPYYVLVSELMLQQTQVARVIPKFQSFIAAFPDEKSLAAAPLAEVLIAWQGLGYNRRAKYLHETAKRIASQHAGIFPTNRADIRALPGVGPNTAGAIEAYAFNRVSLFIETNIRTVFIHHCFNDQFDVDDASILEMLEQTIDREHPREFYWALMDYGSWLKANGVRNISRSKQYKKQSKLEGSLRQMRGEVIRQLSVGDLNETTLRQNLKDDARLDPALDGLLKDGLITRTGNRFHLTK